MVGEGEAVQLLAEVLHHVVALVLAVHQHVEPELLLQADDVAGAVLDEALVLALSISPASNARRAERTSVVCGKEPIVVVGKSGKPEPLGLLQRSRRERALPVRASLSSPESRFWTPAFDRCGRRRRASPAPPRSPPAHRRSPRDPR